MSNPSVFELSKVEIDNSIVCIEDNIGEAIHLHIGSFRIDVTINEFIEITNKLEKVLAFLLKERNIKISDYDPYFLLNFSKYWLDVLEVEEKDVSISDLKIRYINKDKNISEYRLINSPFYKYYLGEDVDLEKYENKVDILQTNKEKADIIYNNLLSPNPLLDDYSIIVDKDNYILDGEEKACSLLKVYGDKHFVKVKILVLEDGIYFGRRLKEKKW